MPWKESSTMDQKEFLIKDWLTGSYTITDLAAEYGVTRPTIYKVIQRFEEFGKRGFLELSRAPHTIPHKTPEKIEALIIEERHRKEYGGRKIVKILRKRYPRLRLPGISTANDILDRHGLLQKKRRRRRNRPTKPILNPQAPNDVWCTDYKGEFKMGSRIYCYPLTISDQYSRFLIGIKALTSPNLKDSKKYYIKVFKKYGLPLQILSDNGSPFAAASALGRLSRLSVWWIKQGIAPVLTQPGHPEQNGIHERMHRELKKKTTKPSAYNLSGQQRKFNEFIEEYNNVRPHESLNDDIPSSFYTSSEREYTDRIKGPEYPSHFEVRYVSKNGGMKWNNRHVGVSTCLETEYIGLDEFDDGMWKVYFYDRKIGYLDERKMRIFDNDGRYKRNLV